MYTKLFLTNEFFKGQEMQYCYDALTHVLNREMITSYLRYLIENKKPFTLLKLSTSHKQRVNGFLFSIKYLK